MTIEQTRWPIASVSLLLAANADAYALIHLLFLVPLLIFFVILFLSVRRGRQLSAFALPDEFPPDEEPDDPAFGRLSGLYAGSWLKNQRYLLLPLQVWGKGFGGRGNGKMWLARQAIVFRRYLIRAPVIIPLALIHRLEVRQGVMVGGKYQPGAVIIVAWGREDLPIVSYLGISGGRKRAEEWAGEIARRGNALREGEAKGSPRPR